jgi:hypothetical protein
MVTIIKLSALLVLFIVTLVAVFTDGFDFTLYKEQKNNTKEK